MSDAKKLLDAVQFIATYSTGIQPGSQVRLQIWRDGVGLLEIGTNEGFRIDVNTNNPALLETFLATHKPR